jgi:putative addiction module component (TIGR02574 family)
MIQVMAAHPVFDYRQLSIPERLQLVEDIWDSIAQDATVDALPISEEHKAILDERLEAEARDPGAGRPWRDVLDDIANRKR